MQELQDKNIRRAVIYWFLTFGYMGLIFYLSSINSIKLPRLDIGFDKVVHLIAYMPLAFLFFLAIHTSGGRKYVFLTAFLLAGLYGISDEIHQSFVPGRDASIGDVIADCLGGIIGCLAANFTKMKVNLT